MLSMVSYQKNPTSDSWQPWVTALANSVNFRGTNECVKYLVKMLASRMRSSELPKTWDEIAELVREMKVLQFKLSIRSCHDFTIRNNTTAADLKRMYFLGVPEPALSGKSTILYYDFEDSVVETHVRKPECRQLIGEVATSDQYSKDEALLRERKRMGTIGISNYELHHDSGRLVFPANGGLFTIRDDFTAPIYQPVEIVTPVTLAKRKAAGSQTETSVEQRSETVDSQGDENAVTCGACLDAKICPKEPNLVAYVYCNDLWVSDIQKNAAQRLTFTQPSNASGDTDKNTPSRVISAGVPSFVTQEEFDRFTGFWWQPMSNSQSEGADTSTFYLMFEEVDETDVPIVKLMNVSGTVEKYRYPRAGKPNARSRLKVLKLTRSNSVDGGSNLFAVQELTLPSNIDQELFSGEANEYLVRAGWLPRGDAVWMRLLDRAQQRLRLIAVPLSSFSVKGEASGAVFHTLFTVLDDNWVNVDDCFHILDGSSLDALQLLVAHEQTGYRHLSLLRCSVLADGRVDMNETVLTSGEWEIQKKSIWVDEQTRQVYFLANRDSPLTKQLFRIRYDANGTSSGDAIERLSDANLFLHEIAVASDFHSYCASVSNPELMPHVRVYSLRDSTEARTAHSSSSASASGLLRAKLMPAALRNRMDTDDSTRGASESRNSLDSLAVNASTSVASSLTDDFAETLRRDAELADVDISAVATDPEGDADADALAAPEASSSGFNLSMYQSDTDSLRCMRGEPFEFVRAPGEPTLHGLIFKPLELLVEPDAGAKRYPTVIYAYGGPQVQLITRSYLPANLVRLCGLIKLGYIVVVVDNRGSLGRGHRFEAELRYGLGRKEAADQVGCVRWLATRYPIDLARVGIYGWSYGGYLSLMTLAQYPATIRCAAACAPVTDWHLYDSGYTERYLDLPESNEMGYASSSVLCCARALPSEPGRLLLVHGYADENVHFSHTAELLRLLVTYGKPYQLLMYPDERHGFRTLEASEHFEISLLHFFETNLRHAPVPPTGSSPTRAANPEI